MKCYSARKEDKIIKFATTLMDLEYDVKRNKPDRE